MGVAFLKRLRTAWRSALPLLLVLLLLLPAVTAQPGPEADETTTEEELASRLAPYAPAIGGIIAALGVILGACV